MNSSICFFAFVLCLLINVAFTTVSVPSSIGLGYYPGRSGNIVVKPQNEADSSTIVLLDKTHKHYSTRSSLQSLSYVNVADVVSQSLGVVTPNPAFTADFIHGDLFDRPTANLLLSIPDLTKDRIHQYGLTNMHSLISEQLVLPLHGNYFPDSSITRATTIATGSFPRAHGIVNERWINSKGKEEHAYDHVFSDRANVADIIVQSFNDRPLTVSISSDSKQALAFCPRPSLRVNSLCLGYSNGEFGVLDGKGITGVHMNVDQSSLLQALFQSLSQSHLLNNHVINVDQQGYQVNVVDADGKDLVRFNLKNDQESAMFFAELMYLDNVLTVLTSSSVLKTSIQDDYPDFFAITIGSYSRIMNKYGANSQEALAAAHIIDTAIPKLIEELNGLYNNRMVSEVLLLERANPSIPFEDREVLITQLNRLVPNQQNANEYFPSLYAEQSSTSEMKELCNMLSVEIHQSYPNYDVFCPALSSFHSFASPNAFVAAQPTLFLSSSTSSSSNSTKEITVVHYQITLWISILLVLLVLYAVYSLAFMSFKKDTLLYSTFNPNWEDNRKRR